MLEILRRGTKSWVVKLLFAVLIVSFGVWGIGGITTGFSTKVAVVGEHEIDATLYGTVLQREQQRLGLDSSQIRLVGLDRYVLGQMVREAAVEELARRLGVSAPDSAVARQVRAEPAFQIAGQFDATQYATAVRRMFPSIADYEESVRRSIATQQIILAATAGSRPPEGAARLLAELRDERRRFEALVLGTPRTPVAEPTEADLAAWLEANSADFTRPETRVVRWIHIDPAELSRGIDIPEAELREAYEAARATAETPETREIDQIVFPTEAEARAARQRLDAGLSFDALLAERGLTRAGATLGAVRRDDLRGARGEAAFAPEAPGIAGPVEAAGGFALLDVRSIVAGSTVPFEAMRETLRQDLARRRAEPDADRLAEALEDLRAGGATLEEAARDLGLTVQRTDTLTRAGGGEGLAATEAFREEAFAAAEGEERRMRPAPDGGYFALQVDAVTPPRLPPLAEVRDAVSAAWRADATRKALRAEAESIKAELDAGAELSAIAEARGTAPIPIGPLRRADPDPRLGPEARAALFAAAPGTAALSAAGGGVAVVVLREILPATADEAAVTALQQALAQSVAVDQFDYLSRALQDEAGVRINQSVLDGIVSQIGG